MNKIFILSASIAMLSSCSSLNKIITIDDDFKNEKSFRLIQELEGHSDEKRRRILGADYIVNLKTLYSKPEGREGGVTAEITVKTEARPENLDSLIFLEADGKKYKFISKKYKSLHFVDHSTSTSTTTSTEKDDGEQENNTEKTSIITETTVNDETVQLMKRTVEIPRGMWKDFSQVKQIKLRFYLANEGVTVRFTSRDRKKFSDLFRTILQFETSPGNA